MTEQFEDATLDIFQVVQMIQNTVLRSRINFDVGDDDKTQRHQYRWSNAIQVLEHDLARHLMSPKTFGVLWEAFECVPAEMKDRYLAALESWRSAAWPSLREDLISELETNFGSYDFTGVKLREHLAKWPELRQEKRIIVAGLAKLRWAGSPTEELLGNLAKLKGSADDTRSVISIFVASGFYNGSGRIDELINAWVGETTWGQLMTALWAPLPEAYAPPKHILDLAFLLRQIPLITGPSLDEFVLDDVSGSSRATWRRSIAKAVGGDSVIREAATEAILWFAHSREDLFSQFTALEINKPDQLAKINPLILHSSRLVALRAQSALDLLANEPDTLEALLTKEPAQTTVKSFQVLPASSTWLGDPRLEQLLRMAFANAATSMAIEVPITASSGEENLVGKLFERLRGACEIVTERAEILARETDRGERLIISLSHRVIGKTEEGADGLVKDHRFSTDVTLILRARRGAEASFTERATFIQAKRLRRGKAPEGEHYSIDMVQINELANQTSSSFLLAVGPEVLGVTMPIVPAQLLIDQLGTTTKNRHLHPDRVSRFGRNLADWLVDDVIGLWTGDPKKQAVSKASAGSGDRDTMLVEITVAMVPSDPEIDSHKR